MRSLLLISLTFLCLSSLLPAEFSRAPYLQLVTDHSIQVVCRTTSASHLVVRYGTSRKNLQGKSDTKKMVVRRTKRESGSDSSLGESLHSAPKGTYQYEIKLDGLKPDTLYYYAIYDGDKRMTPDDGTYFFRTYPKPGTWKDLHFVALGDGGTGRREQMEVYRAFVHYFHKNKINLDMFIHVGDMAYSTGKDYQFQSNFFNVYEPTLKNTVCWPAMGNHEGYTSNGKTSWGPYYDAYVCPTKGEAGGVPSGTEAFYSYDYGRIHFIVLNSYDLDRSPTAAMAQWLKEDLAKTKPSQTDWLIAFWHHPPYTKGSHDSDREKRLIEMRQYILPILESSGVDLVITGHSHIYERSMLIDGAYDTPTTAENHVFDDGDGDEAGDGSYQKSVGLTPHNGEVQVVTGNAGERMSRRGYSPVMRKSILEYGSTIVHVTKSKLSLIMLNKDGKVSDRFQIVKKGKTQPKRIAHPWKSGTIHRGIALIPQKATWKYYAEPTVPEGWHKPQFDDSSWKSGKAGFGYGDDDDTTVLDMRGKQPFVLLRRHFNLQKASDAKKLWLSISYDDGFILYLNGREAVRKHIKRGRGKDVVGVSNHEAQNHFELIDLSVFASYLHEGKNLISVEGHNKSVNSSDFTLHPTLLLKQK